MIFKLELLVLSKSNAKNYSTNCDVLMIFNIEKIVNYIGSYYVQSNVLKLRQVEWKWQKCDGEKYFSSVSQTVQLNCYK